MWKTLAKTVTVNVLNAVKGTKRNLTKTGRDLALILYDDLDFHAMSLPRLFAAIFSIAVLVSWISEQFFNRPFSHFDSLAVLCGGIWTAYAFKKWRGTNNNEEEHND